MARRNLVKTVLLTALGAVVLLLAFETFAVLRARAHTPAALAAVAHREIRLESLPRPWVGAILRVDDPGFWRHHGVDFSTPGQGKTTITQSLVKHMYFKRFHPGFQKIEQSLIAWLVLDKAMAKRDQLEVFVNYSYLGSPRGREVIGFADAARTYYGKPLAQLSDRQFLSLLAMDIAPDQLDPMRHPKENAERVGRIERYLLGQCRPRDLDDVNYPDCSSLPAARHPA